MADGQQVQQQQEAPQIRSSPYQSPMYNFGSSIIIMTDPSDKLYDLELTMRGLQKDEQGNLKEVSEPMMNEEGITAVIGIVGRCVISRNTVMSNLKEGEVRTLMISLAETLRRDLLINRGDYGIPTLSKCTLIYFSILYTVYFTLKRPQDEGEKRFWRGSVQEIKTTVDSPQQKKGIFGKVFGW